MFRLELAAGAAGLGCAHGRAGFVCGGDAGAGAVEVDGRSAVGRAGAWPARAGALAPALPPGEVRPAFGLRVLAAFTLDRNPSPTDLPADPASDP